MRILKLKLKNFIHIYSGMGKTTIELDLTNVDKKINIFIGKMGSGKTAILGHLQPFSSYGTLDVRNQEKLILPEKDGLKEIIYDINGDLYRIEHKYSWSKSSKSHSVKSYIQKNSIELNENGNVSSFKEIIKREFGIEQNYLRLLRLGPNVANLINMKSTERKSFIASLLEDAEVYTTLYQKLNEDYRSINGALNIMSNKLLSLSADKVSELTELYDTYKDNISDLLKKINDTQNEISRLHGANNALSNSQSIEKMQSIIDDEKKKCINISTKINEISDKIAINSDVSIEELATDFGKITSSITNIEEMLLKKKDEYHKIETEHNKIRDYLLIRQSNEQIQILEKKVSEMKDKYETYKSKLSDFQCVFSYEYLVAFINTLNSFHYTLNEIVSSSQKVIRKVYFSDESITKWATRQNSILTGRLVNLEKLLSNIQYGSTYQCPIPLYRPFYCPTESCPFIQTHPQIIKEKVGDRVGEKINSIRNDIEKIKIEIYECEDCVALYPKIQFLKSLWENVSMVLNSINALNESRLINILTKLDSRTFWYNEELLQDTIEKLKIRDSFESLSRDYRDLQYELNELKNKNSKYSEADLMELNNKLKSILNEISDLEDEKDKLIKKRDIIETSLDSARNRKKYEDEKTSLLRDLDQYEDHINSLVEIINRISVNNNQISSLSFSLKSLKSEYEDLYEKANSLKNTLQDIKSTSETYEESLKEKNLIKLILDAVSSKEGIPVIMVKLFLDECKLIVNDLISDIFDDDLEILDFDLREDSNEFKIPYSINGVEVEDISSASQGQTSVISIALSFALCRKAMFDYNVMLLDEIDNSIHKRDREKFIAILSKQMKSVNAEQIFLITHNDIFQQTGLPVNIILTTPESIDLYKNQSKIDLY